MRSASRAVEDAVARTIGAVGTQAECDCDDVKDVTKIQMLDSGDLSKRLIASAAVTAIPRKASQVDAEVQEATGLKTFQSQGHHSSVSPEALGER